MYHPPAGSLPRWSRSSPLFRCDTYRQKNATYGEGELSMRNAIRKASTLVTLTAELYREMTLSALRLVPGRS